MPSSIRFARPHPAGLSNISIFSVALFALIALAAVSGCTGSVMPGNTVTHWHDARQLVLVTVPDWDADHGTLRIYERDGGNGDWHQTATPQPVMVGRAGSAWGLGLHDNPRDDGPVKREGDGRSPAGVFTIGEAFGYAPSARTALPYEPMQASSYCIDVSDSPLYNRIVDTRQVGTAAAAGSTEPMRRDLHADGDQRYRLGFVIEHNTRYGMDRSTDRNQPATPGAGSCIFAHLWKSPGTATAGCTAMDAAVMDTVLGWLRPERRPVFVLLPEAEYARRQAAWGLPAVESDR